MKIKRKRDGVVLSVVTPAFNESQNLPVLYERLKKSLAKLRLSWEWIVIDDHSSDETYHVMEKITRKDQRVNVIRFSRNSGSHLGLFCGLRKARGKCAVGMAADLQDPPETIGQLVEKWRNGVQITWAVRAKREGVDPISLFLSHLYYFIIRYGVGLKQVPPTGADYFLLDRVVLDNLAKFQVKNASILLLLSSLPYRQDFITCDKEPRIHGRSGWNLRKKFKLFFDSLIMFSKAPIYWLLGAGLVLLTGGMLPLMVPRNYFGGEWRWAAYGSVFLGLLLLCPGIYWLKVLSLDHPGPAYKVEKSTF